MAETHPPGPPATVVAELALWKARAVARALAEGSGAAAGGLPPLGPAGACILGADTEVVLDGRILGKPRDPADAARMLRALRGRVHEVVTGVALVGVGPPAGREETLAVATRVRMGECSDAEIDAYVATGEPLDKAGAYAVQGLGGRLVAQVDGCLTNVIGLPLESTARLLAGWGLCADPRFRSGPGRG